MTTFVVFSFLLLSLTSVLAKSKYAMFGCKFEDRAFNHQQPFGQPSFGDLNPANIIHLASNKIYGQFLDKITKIYGNFIKTGLDYNSLSNYLSFYDTYTLVRDCRGYPGFLQFYHDYWGPINPGYEPGGNVMYLMKKLIGQYPELEKSSYFVTRSLVRADLLKEMDPTSVTIPKFFRHEQIAGVIKFSKASEYGYGYIILDPEIGAKIPIVIMDHSPNPTWHMSSIEFKTLTTPRKPIPDSQYITATIHIDYQRDTPREIYLYYHRRPYCSPVETTIKPSFLKFSHSREKFTKDGIETAKLTTHVEMKDAKKKVKDKIYDVQMTLFNGEQTKSHKIPGLLSPRRNNKTPSEVELAFTEFCKRLKIKKWGGCLSYWNKKLETLLAIDRDVTFLRQCKTTAETLENIRKGSPVVGSLSALDPSTIQTEPLLAAVSPRTLNVKGLASGSKPSVESSKHKRGWFSSKDRSPIQTKSVAVSGVEDVDDTHSSSDESDSPESINTEKIPRRKKGDLCKAYGY